MSSNERPECRTNPDRIPPSWMPDDDLGNEPGGAPAAPPAETARSTSCRHMCAFTLPMKRWPGVNVGQAGAVLSCNLELSFKVAIDKPEISTRGQARPGSSVTQEKRWECIISVSQSSMKVSRM